MTMTIVFSGPAGFITQAKSALRGAGCNELDDKTHKWESPDTPADHAVLIVEGDDINEPNAAVESLGWRLRSHWNNDADIQVEGQSDDLRDEVRLLRQELDALKAGK
jgi:hypothetical protein